jgi:hypothetical protein
MIKISNGKIKLDDRVIDLSTFSVRPKVTEPELEQHYESFIQHAEEAADYFENKTAFERALTDASTDKRPKFVPRDPKHLFLYGFRTSFLPFAFLQPSKRRLHDDYFMAAHCITCIPRKVQPGEQEKPLDEKLRKDIAEKFEQYPGYEGIIEIPNDRTQPETKATTFHESLHYLIIRYQAETGNDFVNAFIKEDLPQLEKYQAEHMLHERTVEILTDKLLTHDPDAQFENRWTHYSLNDSYRALAMMGSAIATGLLIGSSFSEPLLLPLAVVPGGIRDYAVERHKQSKKDEILKPVEYPVFKI